jgi:hypothetical protein
MPEEITNNDSGPGSIDPMPKAPTKAVPSPKVLSEEDLDRRIDEVWGKHSDLFSGLNRNRRVLGGVLTERRERIDLARKLGKPTISWEAFCDEHGIPKKTANRYINNYKTVRDAPWNLVEAAEAAEIDLYRNKTASILKRISGEYSRRIPREDELPGLLKQLDPYDEPDETSGKSNAASGNVLVLSSATHRTGDNPTRAAEVTADGPAPNAVQIISGAGIPDPEAANAPDVARDFEVNTSSVESSPTETITVASTPIQTNEPSSDTVESSPESDHDTTAADATTAANCAGPQTSLVATDGLRGTDAQDAYGELPTTDEGMASFLKEYLSKRDAMELFASVQIIHSVCEEALTSSKPASSLHKRASALAA